MRTVALAEVLWKAANEHLSSYAESRMGVSEFSCNAVLLAEYGRLPTNKRGYIDRSNSRVIAFLKSLGLLMGGQFGANFGVRERGPTRQGARYMWLLLAMHCAEDEGITIQVED